MPFIAEAAQIAKNGFMFTAPVGTALPADWKTANLAGVAGGNVTGLTGFNFLGSSSLDDLPEPGNDGGDTDVKGSWDGLLSRSVQTEASVDYLTIQPYQFDQDIMSMYWGQGDYVAADEIFKVKQVGATALERAFLLVIADGPVRAGIYAERASFQRDDKFSLSTEDYSQWPVRVTWLQQPGADSLFQLLGVKAVPQPSTSQSE